MVSGLTCRSLIHFEFIFVHGERKWPSSILSHAADQFSQHHLWKRLSFPFGYSFPLCQRLIDYIIVGLFLSFLFFSFFFFKDFIYLFDKERQPGREGTQAGGVVEEEAGS